MSCVYSKSSMVRFPPRRYLGWRCLPVRVAAVLSLARLC